MSDIQKVGKEGKVTNCPGLPSTEEFSRTWCSHIKTRTVPGEPGRLVTLKDGKVFIMCPSPVSVHQMLELGHAFGDGGTGESPGPTEEKTSANLWVDKLCITDGTVTLPQESV